MVKLEPPLRRLRRERRLTQRALAELGGRSSDKKVVSLVEHGWRPEGRCPAVERIAATLGVEVDDILMPPRFPWLRVLREVAGLTVRQLADRAIVDESVIESIERGWQPQRYSRTVEQIARALGVEEAFLFDGEVTPPPHRPRIDPVLGF